MPENYQNFPIEHGLSDQVDATPQEFQNLEAAKRIDRERWHHRLARFLHLRPERTEEAPSKPEAELLHELALKEKAEFPHGDESDRPGPI